MGTFDQHFAESRSMTEWESKITADFFWQQFKPTMTLKEIKDEKDCVEGSVYLLKLYATAFKRKVWTVAAYERGSNSNIPLMRPQAEFGTTCETLGIFEITRN